MKNICMLFQYMQEAMVLSTMLIGFLNSEIQLRVQILIKQFKFEVGHSLQESTIS